MRVLLAHDYYRSGAPSGEDAVFRNERALLENNGVEVVAYERFNDQIDDSTVGARVRLALEAAWSKRTYEELSAVIRERRPRLAHFHNTFPVISPSAYAACQDNGVAVVQTLHNYRLICPGALLVRDGHPCEACVGTSLRPALQYRCYRGSLPATGAVVWMLARNRARGVYRTLVNRYIALTGFAARRLVAGGLPESRIQIKPNFLAKVPPPGDGAGRYAIYAGRLSEEKGVRTLIAAWEHIKGLQLRIAGDGPLRRELEDHSRRKGLAIDFLGRVPQADVLDLVRGAEMHIIPSECYEGFPMAVLEAYACGTPVVASRIGSLEEIVLEGESGLKFQAASPRDLAEKVTALHTDPPRLRTMRLASRALFDENYTADRNYKLLMDIYDRALADFEARGGGQQ
jgi:glycosyltransferase involved in cell wall biosynthesis